MTVIGIAGGSGSGKTTFARLLTERLGVGSVAVLAQDSYYIDQSKRFDRDGGQVNFDHPDALDWDLLVTHLKQLRSGQAVEVPIYDFATHKRKIETILVEPKPFVLVDGILIYVPDHLREEMTCKVFIQTREEIRFERRLRRDVAERGRTPEGVRAQYLAQVKPMHDRFVEPSRAFADRVISGEADFHPAIEELVKELLETKRFSF